MQICIWEPKQQAVINTIYAHQDTVKSLAFNPHTENVAVPVLASAGGDKLCLSDPRPFHRADILSVSSHKQGKEVEAVAVSPDGSLLVSGGRDGLIVLMTLMVPSVIPRPDSGHTRLTSAVLRRSRAVRERSYIYDATAGEDIPLEEEEEEDLMASWQEVEEMADQLLLENADKKTSFIRMKRRNRFEEKETELPDYATVRKKGTSARNAREKRTKGKSYDIPTMVAHLSAAVRVYGPEEPSSSESEGEEERSRRLPELTVQPENPKVNILTHIKAWSNPESLTSTLPTPRMKPSDLPKGIGKAKTRKEFFESEPLTKHTLEEVEEVEEEEDREGEMSGGDSKQLQLPSDMDNSHTAAGVDGNSPQLGNLYDVGNSYRLEDLMALNSEESLHQWSNTPSFTIPETHPDKTMGQPHFTLTLPTQSEQDGDGEFSDDDDDVVSMI